MKRPTIIFTSDHAGFFLKRILSEFATRFLYPVIDVGPDTMDKNDDYPLYARMGVHAVQDTRGAFGVFICGSGAGMNIVSNRYKGIRAVQAESVESAKRARQEDNANILVLGSRIVAREKAKKILYAFLTTPFSKHPRHRRRIQLIDRIA